MQQSQIVSVYVGKSGGCQCGCRGEHSKNPKTIQRVFTKLIKDERTVITPHHAYLETNSRSYTLSFH